MRLRSVESESGTVRPTSGGDEDAVEYLGAFDAFVVGDDSFDAALDLGQGDHRGVDPGGFQSGAEASFEDAHEVALDTAEDFRQRFDDRDLCAKFGVDRPEFKADVSAADDEQGFGNVAQLQRVS